MDSQEGRAPGDRGAAEPAPTLSLIVPVFNERYLVGELVRRIVEAPLPSVRERQIIVVDHGSSVPTLLRVDRLLPFAGLGFVAKA